MLQQTTTAAVTPYFAEFLRRWPSVADLAAAPEVEVLAAWAGLGYYARARNLIACARAVVAAGGTFPDSEEGLRELPGLGAYTASAVAAIAFGRRAVVVDANVERVVARLFAIAEPLPAGKAAIRAAAERITPDKRAGDFAQAMMDLGATICSPRAPLCLACPLAADCAARAEGDPARYPVKLAKPIKPERTGSAWWIEHGGKVWLVRRPPGGLLPAMRALPADDWSSRRDGGGEPPIPGQWRSAGTVRHTFTHFHLTLNVRLYSGNHLASLEELPGEWWRLDRLGEAGLPTLFAKAADLAQAMSEPVE
jgi:A/G-specific adenine glycosylase